MERSEFYADIEILIDEATPPNKYPSTYLIVDGWKIECYGDGVEHLVPTIKKKLTKEQYLHIKINYLRGKKLKRILND